MEPLKKVNKITNGTKNQQITFPFIFLQYGVYTMWGYKWALKMKNIKGLKK